MRTCANCKYRKLPGMEEPCLTCNGTLDSWTRRRWVTVLMIAAFTFGLIGAALAGAVLVDSLTRPHVDHDTITTRLIPGNADGWTDAVPPMRVYGVDLVIHETAEAIRYDTITGGPYGPILREGEWVKK